MGKFSILADSGKWVEHDYGNVCFRQPTSSGERLVIGPSSEHIEVMLAVARTWAAQQFYVLYVLLVSRNGAEPGRYQSPLIESFEDLQVFFYTHESFLESDARHHIWIGSPSNDVLLVYDQHNVIFAYGDLDGCERILASRGFKQDKFWFPSPHAHSYEPTNDRQEEALLRYFPWHHSPLQKGDEWD